MADNAVLLKIQADTRDAVKSIQSFHKETSKSLSGIESSFAALKVAAVAAFAGLATSKLIGFLEDSVSAASEAQSSLEGMNVALKLAGDFSSQASEDFQKFASSIQESTVFTDDSVLSSVALAKQFGTTNAEAKKLVSAATQLASVTGVSLEEATRQLGQTLDGTAGRLKEQIPALRGMSEAQLRAGGAVDYVNKRFDKASIVMGETFAGRVERAKNAFGELQETIGNFVIQNNVVLASITLVSGAFDKFNATIKGNDSQIQDLIKISLIGLLTAISLVIRAVEVVDSAFSIGLANIKTYLETASRLPGLYVSIGRSIKNFDLGPLKEFIKETSDDAKANYSGIKTRISLYEGVSKTISGITDELSKMDAARMKSDKAAAGGIGNQPGSGARDNVVDVNKIKSDIDSLSKELNKVGKTSIQLANDESVERIKLINSAVKHRVISEKQASELISKTNKSLSLKEKEEKEKQYSEFIKKSQTDISALFDIGKLNLPLKEKVAAISGAVISAIGKGADGARQAIVQLMAGVAEKVLPGLGQALGPLFDLLSQGPDKVREVISAFVENIPVVITNIVDAIPVVIETLLEKLPDLIQALIIKLPEIVNKFSALLAAKAPFIAITFVVELIKNIPAMVKGFAEEFMKLPARIIEEIGRGIANLFNSLGGSVIGGAAGGLLGGITGGIGGSFLPFAEGGIVPKGFPNDNFPARLSSDELVIDRSTTGRLLKFLDQAEGGAPRQSESPGVINVVLQLGEKTLAQALVDLNRAGFRTA